MKRIYFFIIILFVLMELSGCKESSTSNPQPHRQKDKLDEILERGVLTVATDANFPPASRLKEDVERSSDTRCAADQYTADQLEGFDVEVAREISRRLGVEACFVTPTWTLITSGSWADRWDVSIGSMTITEDRMKHLYFTRPYYSVPGAFFVHEDSTSYTHPRDLSGKRIGVSTGATHERYLQKKLSIPGAELEFVVENPIIVSYQADTDAMNVLIQGDNDRLDAILMGISGAYKAIKNGAPLKQLGDAVFDQHAAVAVDKKLRKDTTSFILKLNAIIDAMHADGTLTTLSKAHHVADISKAASRFNWKSLEQSIGD